MTQWRQLVSGDWLWHSHGSLMQSRFNLKINWSMKTPWQEYSWDACSYSLAPVIRILILSLCRSLTTTYPTFLFQATYFSLYIYSRQSLDHFGLFLRVHWLLFSLALDFYIFPSVSRIDQVSRWWLSASAVALRVKFDCRDLVFQAQKFFDVKTLCFFL